MIEEIKSFTAEQIEERSAQIVIEIEEADEARLAELNEEIKGGYTTKMSFGFTVDEDKRETVENREEGTITVLRTITKIRKVYDVSAVSIPANDGTSISVRQLTDGVIGELEAERLHALELNRQKMLTRMMLGGLTK